MSNPMKCALCGVSEADGSQCHSDHLRVVRLWNGLFCEGYYRPQWPTEDERFTMKSVNGGDGEVAICNNAEKCRRRRERNKRRDRAVANIVAKDDALSDDEVQHRVEKLKPRVLARLEQEAITDELPPTAHGWTCNCGWWNTDCNHCRKCGVSIRASVGPHVSDSVSGCLKSVSSDLTPTGTN